MRLSLCFVLRWPRVADRTSTSNDLLTVAVPQLHIESFDCEGQCASYTLLPFAQQFHTCLPQNCLFRNKNHQNPEHSIIFLNTSANVSPHLWKKSGHQILPENHRAIYIVHPPYQFRTAENAVCWSRSTVRQFNHFTTLLQTSEFTQVSPF